MPALAPQSHDTRREDERGGVAPDSDTTDGRTRFSIHVQLVIFG